MAQDSLQRCLTAFDLTLLGVGAIIGAGIFILTGIVAATQAGPGIIFSYILAGLACGFSALSYAELAAAVGGCGSAYGYAYAGFGELIAWVVGWDLLLEYALSVSAVAVGWSSYCQELLHSIHINLPYWLQHGPFAHGVIDIFAVIIILVLSMVLMMGMKASARTNNFIVLIKLSVLAIFIFIAARHVNPTNWVPFLPYGWKGVTQGAALIFFAYVGFDATSTAAEEVLNPQRDLPRGIIAALVLCTGLYILVAGLLTGAVPYTKLNVASPLSHALVLLGHQAAAGLVGVGAIAGLMTVMLVMFYGLSRVFLAMARDQLLPVYFAKIHPRTQTPIRIIAWSGLFIALISATIPMHELAELVNIGTLFAFSIVCSGVIILRYRKPELIRPFKLPFMPFIPVLGIISCLYLMFNLKMITIVRFVVWFVIGLIIYVFMKKLIFKKIA